MTISHIVLLERYLDNKCPLNKQKANANEDCNVRNVGKLRVMYDYFIVIDKCCVMIIGVRTHL